MRDRTRAVHGPESSGPARPDGPLVTPIVQSTTFVAPSTQALDDIHDGRADGFIYSRYGNPTVESAARRVAELERTDECLLTASGMAAITAVVLALTGSGSRIVSVEDVYGGTTALFTGLLPRLGITVETFPTADVDALRALLEAGPADLVYLESPTNPTLRLVPIERACEVARAHGVLTAIDSTFASPVNSRPAELGADVVIHSVTKYLGGHSDILGGAVAGRADVVGRIGAVHKSTGATMDPHAAFLLERGLKTLAVRMRQHNEGAFAVASALEAQPGVDRVHYPGLDSHPQHALAKEQMPGGFGGVLAFDLPGGREQAGRFADGLRLVRNAASLGGVESLVSIPVVQSHRGQSSEALRRSGITPGTVRLSVGIEDPADIIEDVTSSLERA